MDIETIGAVIKTTGRVPELTHTGGGCMVQTLRYPSGRMIGVDGASAVLYATTDWSVGGDNEVATIWFEEPVTSDEIISAVRNLEDSV